MSASTTYRGSTREERICGQYGGYEKLKALVEAKRAAGLKGGKAGMHLREVERLREDRMQAAADLGFEPEPEPRTNGVDVSELVANGVGSKVVQPTTREMNRCSRGWPSDVLHDVGPRTSQRGMGRIDTRRLLALADYIEGLPMKPYGKPSWRSWATPGCSNLVTTKYVDGQTPVVGYALTGKHAGYGLVELHNHSGSTLCKYWLTGYGLICWAWGSDLGMANVVEGERLKTQLQAVLTADPVSKGDVRGMHSAEVTAAMVAKALRGFAHGKDAVDAWTEVVGAHMAAKAAEQPEPTRYIPVAWPEPVAETPKVTQVEEWKRLLMDEDGEAMLAMAGRELAKVEARRDSLDADLAAEVARVEQEFAARREQVATGVAIWTKRMAVAKAMAGEG